MTGPWLDNTQQQAWRTFLRSHARLLAELNRRLVTACGLSIADYEVLVHLSEAERGRLRPFELADAVQWERSRLTHHLGRMEQRGLVRREPCDEDGRGTVAAITTAGRRALRRAAPQHAADVRELFVEPVACYLAALSRAGRRIDAALTRPEDGDGADPGGEDQE